MSALSPTAARDLGRSLRQIRTAKEMSLRDVEKIVGELPRAQYLQQIEQGVRPTPSSGVFTNLERVYRLPKGSVHDLVLKAEVLSALEERGVSTGDRDAVWRMVESRLNDLGYPIVSNLGLIISAILGG
jgi:transcriptional regulator with XRE-family HTH domain